MITRFHFSRFKSYKNTQVLPLGSLTVLIGANAAGKSNAIEAMRFLSWLAQGGKLSSLNYDMGKTDSGIRGHVSKITYLGGTEFEVGCIVSEDKKEYDLNTTVQLRNEDLHVFGETLKDLNRERFIYEVDGPSTGYSSDIRVQYDNYTKGPNKPFITCSDQMAVFTQLDSPATFPDNYGQTKKEIPELSKKLQETLSSILFLDPVPTRMRGDALASEKRLKGDGANLSGVLNFLWNQGEEMKKSILRFIQSLPEQDIAKLDFIEIPQRNQVMVQLVETFGNVQNIFDASRLSDGTLRVLAIAAAMLSAPNGSLVVIEEIDNGVHPSRAHHLLEAIREISEQRKLRVLLSTHNPALLDALPDKAIPDVVFCYRDPIEGDSRLVRLSDMPDAPELFVQGPLGQLMTNGALERFVKYRPTPAQKQKLSIDWLESLEPVFKVAEE